MYQRDAVFQSGINCICAPAPPVMYEVTKISNWPLNVVEVVVMIHSDPRLDALLDIIVPKLKTNLSVVLMCGLCLLTFTRHLFFQTSANS